MSTETPTTPIDPHWTHSERLMQHAFEELAKGERIQASEKAWGAMTHTLKAIADERGLTYERYSQARGVLYAILDEVTDPMHGMMIRSGFAMADNLHVDYFSDVHLRVGLYQDLEFLQESLAILRLEQDLWRERNAAAR